MMRKAPLIAADWTVNRLASLCLMLALFMGGLIPHGYMPVIAGAEGLQDQRLTMVICTASGAETVHLDIDLPLAPEQAPEHDDGSRHHGVCVFAFASHLSGPLVQPALLPQAPQADGPVAIAVSSLADHTGWRPAQPRAPPAA
jgi:hypothetical protein